MQISFVHLRGLVLKQSCLNSDTGLAKMRKTFSRNLWIQIFDWRHNALDTGGDQGVSARRCAAVMRVWFE